MTRPYIITHESNYKLQSDRSGVGHCWRDCDARDVAGDITSIGGRAYHMLAIDNEHEFVIDGMLYRWVEYPPNPKISGPAPTAQEEQK